MHDGNGTHRGEQASLRELHRKWQDNGFAFELWLASVAIFGHTKEKVVIVYSKCQETNPTMQAWKDYKSFEIEGFTSETLFNEEGDGAHDWYHKTKPNVLKDTHKTEDWLALFTEVNSNTDHLPEEEQSALDRISL
jgi:hypothetical protein